MLWEAVRDARQRLRREKGTIRKDWGGRIHVALVYPNSYHLGMSNLGFQTIYGLLNSYQNVVCERVFWEPGARKEDQPVSLESQRPLPDFDVLAFSISYELDYFNVVQLLKASGIPLFAADRDETHPLILAGGPCITANPMPLSPFFDCFAIGEGEAIGPGFVEVLTERLESDKDELLDGLASVPGVYVPTVHEGEPVQRQWLADLDSVATTSVVLTPDTDLSDMCLIEIARGCRWGCRFCLAGFHFRPFRFRPLASLLAQAENGLKRSRRVGLLAAAVSDHPEIDELALRLRRMGAEISVSSLRVRGLSDVVVRALAESGTQTVSLAPEAGSERLRRLINKGATEDDIVEALDTVARHGMNQVKLYFMLGLPTEDDEDIEEMIRLTLRLKNRIEKTGCRIALAAEPFVPKAGTPFQWLPMAPENVLSRRVQRVKNGLARSGVEVKNDSVGWSIVQGVLARGDANLGAALARIQRTSLAAWRRALADCDLSPDQYVHREIPRGEPLPWSVIDSGVKRDYLDDELNKSRSGATTPPCPPRDCQKCGVC